MGVGFLLRVIKKVLKLVYGDGYITLEYTKNH